MKLSKVVQAGTLGVAMAAVSFVPCAMAQSGSQSGSQTASMGSPGSGQQDADDARINAIPMEKLVTATCRQAWQMGGRNKDGFFDIVKRLAELSAQNRGVTLPDTKAAGQKAGRWIRTQALNDPNQLLYAVVDHAIQYSIRKGNSTPVGGAKTKNGATASTGQ